MAERKIEELYPRAPRYVVEVGDNQTVRFAHAPRGSKTMHTRIVNLSESGMAFLVPYLTAPQKDEKIKVEFTAPNADSIACFAKVVRVQVHKTFHANRDPQTFKVVAVEFQNLPAKQREMLNQGLSRQFRKQQQQYRLEQMVLRLTWLINSIPGAIAALLNRLFPSKEKSMTPADQKEKDSSYIDV